MDADQAPLLLAAYFAGHAELEPVAAALAQLHRAEGWGLYFAPEECSVEHRARADALLARYTELTAPGW